MDKAMPWCRTQEGTTVQQVPTVFDVLDELAADISRDIQARLAIATVPHYANLLNVLSWFMDGNDVRHLVEANRASNAPGLREAFRVHGQEESGHYRYALRDLAALGFVRTSTPPAEVTRLHRLVDGWDAPRKLGYSAVVETMAAGLREAFLAMKARLDLRDEHFSCLALHLEVDAGPTGHGATQRRVAQQYLTTGQWVAFLDGAMHGGRAWGAMFCMALRTPLYASRTASSAAVSS
jgi:hypothetical protein